MDGSRSHMAPFKVAVLNCWGALRGFRPMRFTTPFTTGDLFLCRCSGVLKRYADRCGNSLTSTSSERESTQTLRSSSIPATLTRPWSGGDNWKDEKVVTAVRRFVDQGRRIDRDGRADRLRASGALLPAERCTGIDREMWILFKYRQKYNELNQEHFILEDIEGEIDFGESKSRTTLRATTIRFSTRTETTAVSL